MSTEADGSPSRLTPLFLRLYRLTRLLAHLFTGCLTAGLLFPLVSGQRQLRIIKRWSRDLLTILRVRVDVKGTPPSGGAPTVIVANHVSWLDIWVVHAVTPVRFVAKSDIRRWPVVGWLVARAGTIFIDRNKRHDTGKTNRAIVDTLMRGERVGVFPEGTTTDGTQLRAFHASVFQPALGAGARVAAAAIRYPLRDGSVNLDAAYAGDRSLPDSLRLILRHRSIQAELTFAGLIDVSGKTRREIAREAEALIASALRLPAPGKRPGSADGPPVAVPSVGDPTDTLYPEQTDSAS